MKNKTLLSASLALVMAMPAATASAQGTLEDYNRAYELRHRFSADSVFHWARSLAWCDSTHVLHYQISTPQGKKFVSYDADKDEMKTYDSQEAMEKAMGIKPRRPYKPQFGRRHERHWMEVDEEKEAYPVLSPDGKMEAYIEGYNVVVHEAGKPYTEAKRILTQDDTHRLLLQQPHPMESRRQAHLRMQACSGRETLCLLRRIFACRPAAAYPPQAGVCQAGRCPATALSGHHRCGYRKEGGG